MRLAETQSPGRLVGRTGAEEAIATANSFPFATLANRQAQRIPSLIDLHLGLDWLRDRGRAAEC